jgi:hypothetical protein
MTFGSIPWPVSRTAIHPFAAFGDADGDDAFAFTGLNTVNNRVFDQRLDKQAWDHAVDLFINIVNDRELVAKARLLNRDVVFDLIQLFFDVDLLVIFQLDVVAQIARQVKNQLARGVRIKANGRGDRVQRVKQEMGIDFTLQRAQLPYLPSRSCSARETSSWVEIICDRPMAISCSVEVI